MKRNIKMALLMSVIVIVVIASVLLWWWVESRQPRYVIPEPPAQKAIAVMGCEVGTNTLIIKNVGNVDVESSEFELYYVESGEYAGSGFITEPLAGGEAITVSIRDGSLENVKSYLLIAPEVPSAHFNC